MLAMIAILLFSNAQAQEATAFTVAQEEINECLRSSKAVETRKACYSVCESIKEPDQILQCSRFMVSNEKEFVSELFSEEGKEGEIKSFIGMTQVSCKLLNLRGKAELQLNECIADQYLNKVSEMQKEKEELAVH